MKSLVQKALEKIERIERLNSDYSDTDGFNYIIKRQTFAPIAFGTKSERICLPVTGKGLSGFMKRNCPPYHPNVAPNSYDISNTDAINILLKKKISKKGTIGEEVRFKEWIKSISPPSSKYDTRTFPKKVKKNKVPFNQKATIKEKPKLTPGPGSYNLPKKREIPFRYSFGGPREMIPAIPTECVLTNLHRCEMCRLKPVVDYWHKNYTDFLCVQCYSEEWFEQNKYTHEQLKEYKLGRDCSYMHEHDCSENYITILSPKYQKWKRNVETYLSQYFDEFIPQPVYDVPLKPINFKDTNQFYSQFKKYLNTLPTKPKERHESQDLPQLP